MARHTRGMRFSTLKKRSRMIIVAQGGCGNPVITSIVYDSRMVAPGVLYAAVPGTKVQGDLFIAEAIGRGAAAILSENPHPEVTVPWVQTKGIRSLLGILGKTLWRIGDRTMVVVGVTGTNGKTTVVHLFEGLFATLFSPEKVWMFGTIDFHLGSRHSEATHTTPEALDIYRYIGTADDMPAALVMEVSSHSLALDRIGGLAYDIAVFTNLTQDHLDFHGDMESYYQAKKRLFTEYLKAGGCAVINIDDAFGRRLAAECAGKRRMTYGRAGDADVRIASWQCDWDGCRVETVIFGKAASFSSNLRGFFNVYNMTAFIAGAVAGGYDTPAIQTAFDRIPSVNGRMERVAPDLPFAVVVDYAHTPDALDNVLRAASEITRERLLCVFGCGGDRDRKKRPLMGAAVAALCDEAWVTSDNPRTEDPKAIIDEIVGGIPLDFPFRTMPDRREAITSALQACRAGDCLVIAGKGHETFQDIAGVKHHFDDKEVVAEICSALRKKDGTHAA
ncbi:MAG: UDP-N-acetylmuramoyl-L-alanyl-D-glutamate--2,6-diaminopimelate ligase [Chitinispirillaceae bacterium]|nr:UDP-N-acetylmuramoyl-L-alanyl-D-glutamate--2,6-diaminopimelate ligase [Chitinispirillaceae bacterium]